MFLEENLQKMNAKYAEMGIAFKYDPEQGIIHIQEQQSHILNQNADLKRDLKT